MMLGCGTPQGSSNGPIPQASIQEILIADYAPEWDHTMGGSKLLISGNFEGIHDPLFVLLDGIRVSALLCISYLLLGTFCLQWKEDQTVGSFL